MAADLTLKQRCTAHNRDGQPCGKWAIKGGTVCTMHGGRVPRVRQAATRRYMELQLLADAEKHTIEPITDPVAWYQQVAGEVALFLELCRGQLAELTALSHFDDRNTEEVRAAIALYERALDRAEKTGDHMISRGIEAKVAAANVQAAAWLRTEARRLVEEARRRPDVDPDLIVLSVVEGSA